MELREVVKTIREKKGWNQRELADALGLKDQQRISGMENAGSKLEKHWAIFLKLIPLAVDAGILGARDLLPPDEHGPTGTSSDLERSQAAAAKTGQKRKAANVR